MQRIVVVPDIEMPQRHYEEFEQCNTKKCWANITHKVIPSTVDRCVLRVDVGTTDEHTDSEIFEVFALITIDKGQSGIDKRARKRLGTSGLDSTGSNAPSNVRVIPMQPEQKDKV